MTEKLVNQKKKKGYSQSQYQLDFIAKIDRMMAILFAYEKADPDVDLNLSKAEGEIPLVSKLPQSYLYLKRKYGSIGYFDMSRSCWSLDPEDFEHDQVEEGFKSAFDGATFFQYANGENVVDAYCFMLNSPTQNSEVEIKEFSHDDEAYLRCGDFTAHILLFFFEYFKYSSLDFDLNPIEENEIEAAFEALEKIFEIPTP